MGRVFALVGFVALVATTVWVFQPTAPAGAPRTSPPSGVYDPVAAGERAPDGFRQVLGRDAIAPIYEPGFVDADSSGWEDSVQVIGVERDGEAKAYPVSLLSWREMVNDFIAGEPILVTW